MPSAPAEATSVGSTSVWRVLSALRKANRSGIRWLCDGEHHVEVVLNRRERTAGNRLFLDADAGDAMRFTAEPGAAPLHRRRRLLEQDQFATADIPGTIA